MQKKKQQKQQTRDYNVSYLFICLFVNNKKRFFPQTTNKEGITKTT